MSVVVPVDGGGVIPSTIASIQQGVTGGVRQEGAGYFTNFPGYADNPLHDAISPNPTEPLQGATAFPSDIYFSMSQSGPTPTPLMTLASSPFGDESIKNPV